jgi:hypothetical protein
MRIPKEYCMGLRCAETETETIYSCCSTRRALEPPAAGTASALTTPDSLPLRHPAIWHKDNAR